MAVSNTVMSKLQRLKSLQHELARKIDHAHMRDNITEALALEERYKKIALEIENLQEHIRRLGNNNLGRLNTV